MENNLRLITVLIALRSACCVLMVSRRAAITSGASAVVTDAAVRCDVDVTYPGTAVARMLEARARITRLPESSFSDDWEVVRRRLLWAGGLKDLTSAQPGEGYTGHSFNDFNHCDLTCMLGRVQSESNADGAVAGISTSNLLGASIQAASLPELGDGGSWSTCMIGCASEPPRDVAHVQFKSRIAFKLVWSPSGGSARSSDAFRSFVIVDDEGNLLASGTPSGDSSLPPLEHRQANYELTRGSKYALAAERFRT